MNYVPFPIVSLFRRRDCRIENVLEILMHPPDAYEIRSESVTANDRGFVHPWDTLNQHNNRGAKNGARISSYFPGSHDFFSLEKSSEFYI
jgi:hypothetical protein